MNYYITNIKDSVGNNYLGIKIYPHVVSNFLNDLKDYLDEEYDDYVNNQKRRDDNSYHITIINVMDYNLLSKSMGVTKFIEFIDRLFEYPIDDLKFMGIGSATRGDNTSYFIVCKSEKIDSIRSMCNLPKQDLHITLGFKWKDVFGVPKDKLIKPKSKFIKILKSNFYKKDNFNFLKDIKNFTGSDSDEIIPTSISNTNLEILSGDLTIGIGSLDNGELWVMYSYTTEKNKKRIPLTEIIGFFNNN